MYVNLNNLSVIIINIIKCTIYSGYSVILYELLKIFLKSISSMYLNTVLNIYKYLNANI